MPWNNYNNITSKNYVCPYCNNMVASSLGYFRTEPNANGTNSNKGYLYICPHCKNVTYLNDKGISFPGTMYGSSVNNVPESINSLYNEARSAYSVNSFTGVLMLCRKLIMNIAVNCGAKENESFQYYVDFLDKETYIPKNSKKWVDKIRLKGNEATHQIILANSADASEIIDFCHMLLKVIYEFNK